MRRFLCSHHSSHKLCSARVNSSLCQGLSQLETRSRAMPQAARVREAAELLLAMSEKFKPA